MNRPENQSGSVNSPSVDPSEADIDLDTAQLIRRKADRLVGKGGFASSDRSDIEQELRLNFLKRRKSFDPRQGHRLAFASMVLDRCAANQLRDRYAAKRDSRRVRSIDTPMRTEDGTSYALSESLGSAEYDVRRGVESRDPHECAQFLEDVAELIARLPPDLRQVAELLKGHSVSETARKLNVPRSTLYSSVHRIRRRFERADMRDYLFSSR